MRKTIFRIFLVPQVLLLIVFCVIRYIPSISPAEYQIMGLLGLLTPVLAIVNFVFLVSWLFLKKYNYAFVAGLGFLVAWNVLCVCFGFNFFTKNDVAKSPGEFTIMSYNVRLLDLYDWTGDAFNRKKMLNFINEKKPDVLCLQEFYTKDGTGLDNIAAIKTAGGYEYVETCAIKQHRNRLWGSVIFSKFPIMKNTNVIINEEEKNLIQETLLKVGNEKVRIYNIHLHSNKLSPTDIAWGKNGDALTTAKTTLANSKSVLKKLLQAYKQRGDEANLSAFVIEDMNATPTIVCGDLNDLPSSYSYFNIRGNMQDAFLARGRGIGPTYNGKISFLRIDYLFHSADIELKAFEKFNVPYSDHFPLLGKYSFD